MQGTTEMTPLHAERKTGKEAQNVVTGNVNEGRPLQPALLQTGISGLRSSPQNQSGARSIP